MKKLTYLSVKNECNVPNEKEKKTTINVNVLFIIYGYVVLSLNMWQESRHKEIRSMYSPICPRSYFLLFSFL